MRILNRFSVWLALAGVTLAAWTVLSAGKQTPMPTPLVEPPRSPYNTTVAATASSKPSMKTSVSDRRPRDL